MFYLHISNRTENLLRHLAEVIRLSDRRDPFAPEFFLIQSRGMERMISQAMAAAFRSWCHFKYLLPLDFLAEIAGRLGLGISPDSYERGILVWRIEGLLRELEPEVFLPLASYVRGENAALKRYQLAQQLANCFDQYQIWRSDMLAAWDAGNPATDHPAEAWQMALWRRLAEGSGGVPHRGLLLRQVIDKLHGPGDLSRRLPARISVFGLHIMPPLFLQYLQGLSRHSDVHLYLLSPCRHYWGDIEHQRRLLKMRLARLEQGAPPESEVRVRHPLLAALGWQGRDFQEMMLKNIDFEIEFNSFEDPAEVEKPTLLHRLQSDLLRDAVPDGGAQPVAADDSLAVVSCHSRLREIQILKDHLLRLLHRDPALELREIIVMAPDIQDYAPLIPAVFDDIQHSIADRTVRGRNPVINAFIAFLKLFDGRFGWVEVLDLLKHEAVYPNFEIAAADLDTIRHWVTASGIRWGLSAGQRRGMGLPGLAENTWAAGLDRLLMGYAIDSEGLVDGILPLAGIEGSQAVALGGLCRFVEIFERAGAEFERERGLAEWSVLLLGLAERLFGAAGGEDLLELRQTLGSLAEVGGRFHSRPVELRVVRAWFEQAARETRSSSGFLRGSLTFCSMLPMRSIPFKVVCLLGQNDGEFPRNDRYATFDLMAPPRSRPGDRSSRTDDRYQFLESILSARSHLVLSYIGRSITTNAPIPPSVVVTELLEHLQNAYGIGDLVVEHPLHPFSRRYFSAENDALFSYSPEYCETAVRLQQPKEPARPWWSGELAPDLNMKDPFEAVFLPDRRKELSCFVEAGQSGPAMLVTQVSVGDLLAFFANPQRWFVKDCLGIRLGAESDPPEEREPFVPAGLDAYHIDQEILAQCRAGREPGLTAARLRAEGRWSLGTPGSLSFARKYSEISIFIQAIDRLGMGERLPDKVVECEIGGLHLVGSLPVYQNGILLYRYAPLTGKDLLQGWIHHLLLRLFPDCVQQTWILSRDGLVTFAGDCPSGPSLERLVELFTEGCRQPSRLLVEPALCYVRQLHAGRADVPPLVKAQESLQARLDKGYEPEWALLYRNLEAEEILDEGFEGLCREIIDPIWSRPDAV